MNWIKKLSLKILKLSGNDLLQREQLRNVFGGYTSGGGNDDGRTPCRITWINHKDEKFIAVIMFPGNSPSSAANSHCVNLITQQNAKKCSYDCFHDGYGQ